MWTKYSHLDNQAFLHQLWLEGVNQDAVVHIKQILEEADSIIEMQETHATEMIAFDQLECEVVELNGKIAELEKTLHKLKGKQND